MTGRPLTQMAGKRFGALTVIDRIASSSRKGCVRWLCRCDCGMESRPTGQSLRSGSTQSCGCLSGKRVGDANRRHGMHGTPTYESWRSMHKRCNDPSSRWHNGLGITVCPEWATFDAFFADMGVRPAGKTLDRRDGKLGYFKSNCRWATAVEQQSNKSNNQYLTHAGESLTLAEWSRRVGLSVQTIRFRLAKGANVATALTQPLRHRKERAA